MFTLYNLCSVNWGIFSTSGDVQYMGGYHEYIGACSVNQGYHYECGRIPCVHRVMFSTSEKISSVHGGGGGGGEYHEYTGCCSAYQMDIMMHLGEQLDKSFKFLLKTPMYS